jgi:hypothetical protein
MNTEASPAARTQDRSLLLIGLGVVALVALTIVVVLLAGGRQAVAYPVNSPEGAVQRYLAAFDEGDYETAYTFFSEEVRGEMDLDEYERAVRSYGSFDGGPSRRVLFDRTSGDGDRMRVHLTVEEFYGGGGLGGGDTYRSSREVLMVRENGAWRIDEPLVWLDPAPFPEPAF